MSNLHEQAVVPPSQSYIKVDRRHGSKTPHLEVGTRRGNYTILENYLRMPERPGRAYWYRVRCDCGFETIIRSDSLKEGSKRLYGCPKCKKVCGQIPIGTRFDKYLVIDNERVTVLGGIRFRACLVRCDCSTERVVAYMNLKSGNSGGCGCARAGRKVLDTEWRCLLSQLGSRARNRGVPCTLTLPQFQYISSLQCAYCDAPPANFYGRKITIPIAGGVKRIADRDNLLIFSGIDRVDSSGGYVPGNVLPCCAFCNRAKDDWTVGEFIERLARLGCTLMEADIHFKVASIGESLLKAGNPNL